MESSFLVSSIDDFEPPRPKPQAAGRSAVARRARLLRVLIGLVVAIAALELAAYFFVMPYVSQTQVLFSGVSAANERVYREAAKELLDKNWFAIDEATVAGFFYDHYSSVENVSVRKSFPNQVEIDVVERMPVAAALVPIQGASVPILIDRRGVVFQVGGSLAGSNATLLSGLSFGEVREGARLHSKLQPLLERLSSLRSECPSYLQAISEIKVIPKSCGTYELEIFPVQSRVKVLVDRNFDKATLEYMMIMLDVLKSIDPSVDEIDLRNGSRSYKTKAG